MKTISFADIVHQSLFFRTEIQSEALVLALIDTPWVQRLRDIAQTANTRLVYMFSEHSRFGHCLGAAFLACQMLEQLQRLYPGRIEPYKNAIAAAALLHDVGHLAPGSHMAQKIWFPNEPDSHELLGCRIIAEAPELLEVLEQVDSNLPSQVVRILSHDPQLPPWTWQIISGGGWNIDRGNWCIVDSVMAGVDYGKYNIPALTDSIRITSDDQLALRENRLDAMMHFAVSRHAMYTQMYQHRVILGADVLSNNVIRRARELGTKLTFADEPMRHLLSAISVSDLSLDHISWMREAWWRYHLLNWQNEPDAILADLSKRTLNRELFKTVTLNHSAQAGQQTEEHNHSLLTAAHSIAKSLSLDPNYYIEEVTTKNVHKGDQQQSMLVLKDNGTTCSLAEALPLYDALVNSGEQNGKNHGEKSWLIVPKEVKARLERDGLL
jgi:uncharacterized protein